MVVVSEAVTVLVGPVIGCVRLSVAWTKVPCASKACADCVAARPANGTRGSEYRIVR